MMRFIKFVNFFKRDQLVYQLMENHQRVVDHNKRMSELLYDIKDDIPYMATLNGVNPSEEMRARIEAALYDVRNMK